MSLGLSSVCLSKEAFILFVDSLKAWSDSRVFEMVGLLKSLPLSVAGSEWSRFGCLSLDIPGASLTDWNAELGWTTERWWDSFVFE